MLRTKKRRLFCVATKRSGHHAFLDWIMAGMKQPWTYYNNVNVMSNSFSAARSLRQDGDKSTAPGAADTPILTFSAEDRTLNQVLSWPQLPFCLPSDIPVDFIIFLRDPLNSFASLLQVLDQASWIPNDEVYKARARSRHLKSWANLAQEFLYETELLSSLSSSCQVHRISYNDFVTEKAERDRVSRILNLQVTEMKTSLSCFAGGGNTFFSDKFDYTLDPEKLETRWKEVGAFAQNLLGDELLNGEYSDLVDRFYAAIGRQKLLQEARSVLN